MGWLIHNQTVARRYGAALVCLAAALALRWAVTPWFGSRNPYITVFLGLLLVARFWGAGPAVLVGGAGVVGVNWILHTDWRLWSGIPDSFGIALFSISALTAIWVIELLRRSTDRAALGARLAAERLAALRERNQERERQQKVSALLTAVVESSADAIISRNLDGVIQSWNSGAAQMLGYAPEEVIGQSINILIPLDRLAEEGQILGRIQGGERVAHYETVRLRKDGGQAPVSLAVSPIRDERGGIVGLSEIARDISAQKELEANLLQTQKLESLGVLAGGLAHDFNNLLTGIMGNASLAEAEIGNTEAVRRRIAEVLSASERAALLVRQMLAYAGKGAFVRERLQLSQQIDEIVTLIRTSISRSVELDLRLDPGLPLIEGDPAQIQQVIMNLAINGAEAIGEGPGKLTIATSKRVANGAAHALLEVTDTGCGMDEHIRSRIFDPFFTTKFTGRGLGLAAVLGIIRAHHASITVDSEPEKGTRIQVLFPACSGGASTDRPPEPEEDLFGSGNVLVVDDEELVRGMARFTLERYGYEVEVACDGQTAVDAFAARPEQYSAVLLDLTMPVMNGEEALRRIRRIRSDVPIVLSSGFSESEALQRFRQNGLSGYLQKPYTATALARRIKQALEQSEAR